jgi:hypothetical protein
VDGRNPAHILFAFRTPGIVSRLHAHPNPSAVSEQFAEPNRNRRRDRLSLAQNIIEMLPGNTEKPRDLGLSLAGRGYHVLPQQGAGMGWAAIGIPLSDRSHDFLSSVVLLEVDPAGVAVLEFEREAPRPIHVNRIARGLKASQSMEIKARDVHFFWYGHDIQPIETTNDALMHFRVDLRGAPLLPKFGESLAFEASDHASLV